MKKRIIFLILLVILMPVSLAKEVKIVDVGGEQTGEGISEGGMYYAVMDDRVVASVKNNEVNYYHRNRLGSNVVGEGRSKTLPFGQELLNPEHAFTFTGKEEDSSGLYYFGARYYDSDLGRFVSTDPVVDNHAYVYTMNNPLRFVDPSGEQHEAVEELPEVGYFDLFLAKRKSELISHIFADMRRETGTVEIEELFSIQEQETNQVDGLLELGYKIGMRAYKAYSVIDPHWRTLSDDERFAIFAGVSGVGALDAMGVDVVGYGESSFYFAEESLEWVLNYLPGNYDVNLLKGSVSVGESMELRFKGNQVVISLELFGE